MNIRFRIIYPIINLVRKLLCCDVDVTVQKGPIFLPALRNLLVRSLAKQAQSNSEPCLPCPLANQHHGFLHNIPRLGVCNLGVFRVTLLDGSPLIGPLLGCNYPPSSWGLSSRGVTREQKRSNCFVPVAARRHTVRVQPYRRERCLMTIY